jgi:hypothetical protein
MTQSIVPEEIIRFSRLFLKAYYEKQLQLYQSRLDAMEQVNWADLERMLLTEIQSDPAIQKTEQLTEWSIHWLEGILSD